jgi:hypothetical protein
LEKRLAAIRKAYASGALVVRHGDTSTTFRTLEEMERIMAQLEAEINVANGTPRRRVRYVRQFRKAY